MGILNSALSILLDITKDKQTFHNAVKAFFAKEENNGVSKSDVYAFVGCELRHFIVFNEVSKEVNPDLNETCKLAVGLALSNGLFLKRIDDDVALNFVKEIFDAENVEFDAEEFKKFYLRKKQGEPLINADLDKGSLKFISQRYNLPEWMVKMWTHNFSRTITYRVARAMTKNPMQFVRINTLLTDKEKVLAKNTDCLTPTELSEDLLIYNGKTPLRRQKFISTNQAYQISSGLKEMLDTLPMENFQNCVVYSGSYNVVPLELGVKYQNKLHVEHLVEPNKDLFLFKNALNRYQIKGIHTTECTVGQFVTAISNKVSCFILLPDSSALDRLRFDPDYFLSFDRASLDSVIENQTNAINEASNYIEDNGFIVYAVQTINKKEGQNIIGAFLGKHPEFELISEKQHFPHDPSNSTLYYAIIKKKVENGQN